MSYYDNQESVANIYVGLVDRGWKCYGYKADESDGMTDYWSPARWEGIAEKDGYILLVDVYGTSNSGYKQTKQGYTPDYDKINKLKATINDAASSQNEKETSQMIIDKMMKKEKESTIIINEYPTFKNANPKGCNWHIEKDGNIIAKGKGAFQCDGYLFGGYEVETMKKVNAFIDRIEKHIADNTQLVPNIQKVVKKVIKPVEVTDRKTLQIGDVLSFEYHGHYWKVYSISEKTFSYQLLGSEKRGYQETKNGKRYYDYMTKFNKNLEEGKVKIHTLQEVEEVTERIVYKKAKRDNTKKDSLLQGEIMEEVVTAQETAPESTETTQETIETNNIITYETGTGSKGNGIEITFTNKPSEEIRKEMKAHGYRWGGKKRPSIWWAVMDEEKLSLAQALAGETIQNEVFEEVAVTKEETIYNTDDMNEPEEMETVKNDEHYKNEVIETATGFYCHFKSWSLDLEQIETLLNEYNIPFYIAGDKFIFEGVTYRDITLIKTINEANESILWDDSFKHHEFTKEVEESKNSYIAEMEAESIYNSTEALDLQFFANQTIEKGENDNMNSLLNKFNNINIENDTRISEIDKKYCEDQESMYKEAVTAMQQAIGILKPISNKYKDNEYSNRGYIDKYSDIDKLNERIISFKKDFISNIVQHFKTQYNVSLDSADIKHKYKEIDITYQDIVNEVFEQLGGFNFNEKAVKEIIDACQDTVYRYEKVTIKKNKLSIADYVYWRDSWDGKYKELGWNDSKLSPLFKGLSHFETESTDTMFYYNDLYKMVREGDKTYNIFDKQELGYNKVKSIKFFKNGKIEIEFQTNEQASEFSNTYLKQ